MKTERSKVKQPLRNKLKHDLYVVKILSFLLHKKKAVFQGQGWPLDWNLFNASQGPWSKALDQKDLFGLDQR